MHLLRGLPGLQIRENEPLSRHTRFGLGGPARWFLETSSVDAFAQSLRLLREHRQSHVVIGGGSNLVVADAGYPGAVLRFTGRALTLNDSTLHVQAGALLQAAVDNTIDAGLAGFESLTRIPGEVGGAVYGNAGAYGRSIHELVDTVTFTDGLAMRKFTNAECEFHYRESIFKRRKDWIILEATFRLQPGEPAQLQSKAREIQEVRDAKYPPTMRCAGSIFKNVFFAHLPAAVQPQVPAKLVRDGKIPSAWFLEQAGVKGQRRGDIQVAEYHANLIYNDGDGTTADLLAVIADCKARVQDRFGFSLEEEVQYVG